jgi:digeranylgeranylglycerophospholipid reductase
MLVGDAAGQVISLTGAGINYAIYAGNLAGKTAALAFSKGKVDFNTLKKYERQWAGSLGKQQLRSYALKQILIKKHSDTFLNGIARSLSRNKNKNMTVLNVFLRTFAAHPVACIKALFLFR